MRQTVQKTGVHYRAASVRQNSFNADDNTIDVVFSTGAQVQRYDWWNDQDWMEALSLDPAHIRMDRLNNGAPFLDTHSSYSLESVLGVIVDGSARTDGKLATAKVRLSTRDSVAGKVADIKAGIIRNVSVGYRTYTLEKQPPADPQNRTEIPVYLATDWEPFEISAVPIGADAGAGFRAADQIAKHGKNACTILEREGSMTKTANETTTEAAPATPATTTTTAPATAPAGVEEARAAATTAERTRQADIRRACRAAKMEQAYEDAAIDSNKTVDAVRAEILEKLAANDAAPGTRTDGKVAVVRGGDEKEKFARGATSWIAQRAGVLPILTKHDSSFKADAGEFRGMTLVDLARESLELNGVKTRGMSRMELVGRALTTRGATQSTSDFPVLLENILHKTLLAQYAITPDTWSRWCSRGTVTDFRAHPRYKQGMFGALDAKTELGEFKNKAIPDGVKELIQIATKGNIINLSREAIINDDMNAFSTLATRLGRAAKLSIELDAYASLLSNGGAGPTLGDGNPLFHVSHNNIVGAPNNVPPSVAAFDAMRVLLGSQKDVAGQEVLDLRMAVGLFPIGLGGDARVINEAQYDPDTANKLQRPNKSRGLFTDIVDTARLTGTAYYGFADPNIAPCIEVAFLEGVQDPVLEMQDGWRVDGVEWKVRLDYGVGGVDFRGAIKNPGA